MSKKTILEDSIRLVVLLNYMRNEKIESHRQIIDKEIRNKINLLENKHNLQMAQVNLIIDLEENYENNISMTELKNKIDWIIKNPL